MIYSLFKKRKRNQKPWFKLQVGAGYLTGKKLEDGLLSVLLSDGYDKLELIIPREQASKITQWMLRSFPINDTEFTNVIDISSAPRSVETVLPLSTTPGESDSSHTDTV